MGKEIKHLSEKGFLSSSSPSLAIFLHIYSYDPDFSSSRRRERRSTISFHMSHEFHFPFPALCTLLSSFLHKGTTISRREEEKGREDEIHFSPSSSSLHPASPPQARIRKGPQPFFVCPSNEVYFSSLSPSLLAILASFPYQYSAAASTPVAMCGGRCQQQLEGQEGRLFFVRLRLGMRVAHHGYAWGGWGALCRRRRRRGLFGMAALVEGDPTVATECFSSTSSSLG